MPTLSPFDEKYLRLTLEVDKHVDGYIDSYFGPTNLKEEIQSQPKQEPTTLLHLVDELQQSIPTIDEQRQQSLTAKLRAIQGTIRILTGEKIDYLDEIKLLYDIEPQLIDETLFEKAHQELDTALEGEGRTIMERLTQRRQRFHLKREQILPLVEIAKAECRQRTQQLIALPDKEDIQVTLVENQPWSAYNWYLGNAQSLIEFNTDTPKSAMGLLDTFAHEAYPGHHTEHLLKEAELWNKRGYGEQAVQLLHSPTAVVSEGIATTALEIIFPNRSHDEWTAEVLMKHAGIEPEPIETTRRVAQAVGYLPYVSSNAAILYHTGQLDKEKTLDYIQTYSLSTRPRAEKGFEFITSPLFRSYIFCYRTGYRLIDEAAKVTGDKQALFLELLTGQHLPSQLKALGSKE